MAFSHGTAADVFLDGFDVTCFVNEVSFEGEIDASEITTLCKTAKEYIPGMEDATASFSGFYDHGVDTADLQTLQYKLQALHRTITSSTYYPAGTSQGSPAYLINGMLTSHSVGTTVDEAATTDFEMQSSTGINRGIAAVAQGAVTTTGATGAGALDNGAATSNGLEAILQVTAVSGTTPTLDVKVQHTDDISGTPVWVDLITFAQKNSRGSEYKVVASGDVERYLRVTWTVAGTTPSFTMNVAVARK